MVIRFTELPADGEISGINVIVDLAGSSITLRPTSDITEINTDYTFSGINSTGTSTTIDPGEKVGFILVEFTTTDRPFTYEVMSFTSSYDKYEPNFTLSSIGELEFAFTESSTGNVIDFDSIYDTTPVVTQVLPTPDPDTNLAIQNNAFINLGRDEFNGRAVSLVHLTSTLINHSFSTTVNDAPADELIFLLTETITNQEELVGQPSIITVFDYSGGEITSFTASRESESSPPDVTAINQVISNAINSNNETPIDFTAADDTDNNRIVLTASTFGTVNGLFNVVIDHGENGNGTLAYTSEELTVGADQAGETSPTLLLVSPQGTRHTINIFGDTLVAVSKNFEEIAEELRRVLMDEDWEISGSNNNIFFTSNLGGVVTGRWTSTVQSLGTSGTTDTQLNDGFFNEAVITEGEARFRDIQFASGKTTLGNYVQASPVLGNNYRAERTQVWTGSQGEPDVSVDRTQYVYLQYTPDSEDAIFCRIDASEGTSFRNGAGNTVLTATVTENALDVSDERHIGFDYQWTYQGNVICVDGEGNQVIAAPTGNPLVAQQQGDAVVCTIGVPADSTISRNVPDSLRSITVGAEDVNRVAQFVCDVSNIGD